MEHDGANAAREGLGRQDLTITTDSRSAQTFQIVLWPYSSGLLAGSNLPKQPKERIILLG